ncbi:MAG: 4-alpha-glucanotransferase [Bacillota bacterium]
MKKRKSGILMSVSSLPGDYGIGDFGKEAYSFVDFLHKSRQKNWQILPLGVTGYGDSPYQCISSFAGNPYFIDLDELIDKGYITREEVLAENLGGNPERVQYGKLYHGKYSILRKAYNRSKEELWPELKSFYDANRFWLREFSLFMTIKALQGNKAWQLWEKELKDYNSSKVNNLEVKEEERLFFWVFTQYLFMKQWKKLKEYANKRGIRIIGDLPIYVSGDSSDIWANPYLFKLDKDFEPITLAGVPPDYFTSTGQLWGNPVYDWDAVEKNGYNFWIKRIQHSFKLYDTLRIDHFRGFESFWEVPAGSIDAVKGKWVKGPGMKLFDKIRDELGELDIIAEDLGFQTDKVVQLIKDTGFPGMKILQFAFDPEEDSDYLPHNHERNSIIYTGTHDNKTVRDWIGTAPLKEKRYAIQYLKLDDDVEGYNWGLIRGAWCTGAYLAIAQMQDFLDLGEESRMNTPATLGDNWTWRVRKSDLNKGLAERIALLTRIYRRD